MEIKTKYNIGDLVYCLSNNAVIYYPIGFIKIDIGNTVNSKIKYRIDKYSECEWIEEDKLFPTKEELLKSL